MLAGGGLTITGSHHMCGDYLYSGHTVMLTLTYLFIKECKKMVFKLGYSVTFVYFFGLFFLERNEGSLGLKHFVSVPCLTDSPRRFWYYHWACGTLCGVGLFCILLAHDHYTIDVVIAYYITTRLFWWYHTMANQSVSFLFFLFFFELARIHTQNIRHVCTLLAFK